MKTIDYILILVLAFTILVGCARAPERQAENVPADGVAAPTGMRGAERVTHFALGTLYLEDTENAVTSTQAAEMLPLWRMIQGGSLKSETETDAVLKQIEGMMNGPQLAAINAVDLEDENLQAWMQEQGIDRPALPAEGQGPAGQDNPTAPGGPGMLQGLSEEERAKMREELSSMTAEERATRMAEMGLQRPDGEASARPDGGLGQSNALLSALTDLLIERAG